MQGVLLNITMSWIVNIEDINASWGYRGFKTMEGKCISRVEATNVTQGKSNHPFRDSSTSSPN